MKVFFTPIFLLLLMAGAGTAAAQADLRVAHVIPGPYLRPGTYTFTFGLENRGSQAAAFTVFWQLDNGPVKSRLPYTPPALNGNSQEVQIVSDSFKITVTTANKIFKVWVATLNGVKDANHANDTLTQALKVMNNLPDKNVLMEVYKHQICGPCYPAAVYNHQYIESMPNYNLVYLYTSPTDVLYNADAAAINTMFDFAHPAVMFDRYKFPYLSDINLNYFTLDNVYQLDELGRRDVMYEPLGVSVASMTLDTPTRVLKVRLKAKAVDTISGDLRFNLWLTEDSIKAYQAEAPDPNNYWHSHVLRAFVGGQWGKKGSLPAVMYPGGEATYDFQYTIPANYVLKRLNVIGLVQAYSPDSFARRIINSVRAKATQKLAAAGRNIIKDIKVYPNPAKDRLWLQLGDEVNPDGLKLEVTNAAGQCVLQQAVRSRMEFVAIQALPAGQYLINVAGAEGYYAYPFVKTE